MTTKRFKSLKVGDTVTLKNRLRVYAGGRDIFRDAGEAGIVGAVNVPAVRGRERNFVCVDFSPRAPEFLAHNNLERVGAFIKDLI